MKKAREREEESEREAEKERTTEKAWLGVSLTGCLWRRLALLTLSGAQEVREREREHGYGDYDYNHDIVCHNANTNVLGIFMSLSIK